MCALTPDTVVELPTDMRAPSQARALLRDTACRAHVVSLDIAMLLASEVVTNAVLHGAPPITLRTYCTEPGRLKIEVSDTGASMPVAIDAGLDADHGRGLILLDMLATDWGVQPQDPGKTVWFRLTGEPRR
jgi:anti-sigma regulatory factor (Ser/Thr protein kinase)